MANTRSFACARYIKWRVLYIPKKFCGEVHYNFKLANALTHLIIVVDQGAEVTLNFSQKNFGKPPHPVILRVGRSQPSRKAWIGVDWSEPEGRVEVYLTIFLKENAKLKIIKHFESSFSKINFGEHWYFADNSSAMVYEAINNMRNYFFTVSYNMLGKNSSCESKIYYVAKEKENYDLIFKQNHIGVSTFSNVQVKAVLLDESRSNYRGLIDIARGAEHSKAFQKHTALQLSPRAKNIAVPSLEVKNSQVECKHGSATGVIDEMQLWYLASRAIGRVGGTSLIVDGFLSDSECDGILDKLRRCCHYANQ